jgi:hypothetical protein
MFAFVGDIEAIRARWTTAYKAPSVAVDDINTLLEEVERLRKENGILRDDLRECKDRLRGMEKELHETSAQCGLLPGQESVFATMAELRIQLSVVCDRLISTERERDEFAKQHEAAEEAARMYSDKSAVYAEQADRYQVERDLARESLSRIVGVLRLIEKETWKVLEEQHPIHMLRHYLRQNALNAREAIARDTGPRGPEEAP